MDEDRLHHPRADATPARGLVDDDVCEICVGREIGDGPGKAELLLRCIVDTDAERVGDRALQLSPSHRAGPMRCAQHGEHYVDVDAPPVGAQNQVVSSTLNWSIVHARNICALINPLGVGSVARYSLRSDSTASMRVARSAGSSAERTATIKRAAAMAANNGASY